MKLVMHKKEVYRYQTKFSIKTASKSHFNTVLTKAKFTSISDPKHVDIQDPGIFLCNNTRCKLCTLYLQPTVAHSSHGKTQKLTTKQPIVTAAHNSHDTTANLHCGPQLSRHNNQFSRHNSQFSRHNTEFRSVAEQHRDPEAIGDQGAHWPCENSVRRTFIPSHQVIIQSWL